MVPNKYKIYVFHVFSPLLVSLVLSSPAVSASWINSPVRLVRVLVCFVRVVMVDVVGGGVVVVSVTNIHNAAQIHNTK